MAKWQAGEESSSETTSTGVNESGSPYYQRQLNMPKGRFPLPEFTARVHGPS